MMTAEDIMIFTKAYDWPSYNSILAAIRFAQADALESAAKEAHVFQDMVGWQPGESRNALVGDIEAAIRKLKLPEVADP